MSRQSGIFLQILTISLLCISSLLPAYSEKFSDQNLELLIRGDLEGVIKSIEEEDDFDWKKNKIKLDKYNSDYYAIALAAMGEIEKVEKFLDSALKRHPENPELQKISKDLELFKNNYKTENLSSEEEASVKLMELFPEYLEEKETSEDKKLDFSLESIRSSLKKKDLEREIENLISKSSNRNAYLPSKLEYLLENEGYEEAQRESESIIQRHKGKLFPKTLDFLELAQAYRSLGILEHRNGKEEQALMFYKLAINVISKARSLWLIEDLRAGKIMRRRYVKFGYIFPQRLAEIRNKLLTEIALLGAESVPHGFN